MIVFLSAHTFDVWVIFSVLPFLVCLFWTVQFVLDWHEASPAKHKLTQFMAIATLLYLCHAIFFSGTETALPYANSVYAFCNLSVFPLYYIYIRRLTCKCAEGKYIKRTNLLMLFPSLIIGIWAIINNFILGDNTSSESLRLTFSKVLFFALVLPILFFCLKRLNQFDKRLEDYYSDTECRSVGKSLKIIMIILVVCSVCSVAFNHVGRECFSNNNLLFIPSILFSSLLFALGYVGNKQSFTIDDLEKELEEESATIIVEEADIQQIVTDVGNNAVGLQEKLEKLMIEDKLFLECDLKLADVAKQLCVSRSILSNFFNQTLGVTFSEYINKLRINYAIEYLKAAIASNENDSQKPAKSYIEFGFSSEASFYRSFRKYTGMTPKQMLSQIK